MHGLYELQMHVLAIPVQAPPPTYLSLGLDTDHLTTLTNNLLHWLVQHVRTTIDSTQPKRERERERERREGAEEEEKGGRGEEKRIEKKREMKM